MPEAHSLILFILSTLILLVIPGPAVLYIVTRTLQQGRKAGLLSVLGLCGGGLVHVVAAIFGLSAIISSSATAFITIKFLGAGYLIFLGFKTLLSSEQPAANVESPPKSSMRLFMDGVIVNVLNPKTAIFFLAFLPQFVSPIGKDTIKAQLAFLGILFICLAVLTDTLYAIIAGAFQQWISRRTQVFRYQRYFSASVYFSLGLSTAISGRKIH